MELAPLEERLRQHRLDMMRSCPHLTTEEIEEKVLDVEFDGAMETIMEIDTIRNRRFFEFWQ